MKAEMRTNLLSRLGKLELGTNRIEFNQIKSRGEMSRDTGRNVTEIVKEMEAKVKDARSDADFKRRERNRWRRSLSLNEDLLLHTVG